MAAARVVAAAAAVTATVISSGHPNLSVVGTWEYGTNLTFTFAATGSGTYQVSTVFMAGATRCSAADDGTITGGNGHFQGSINLHNLTDIPAGQCPSNTATARITIGIAASGASPSVNLVANAASNCSTCKPQTWTRQS